MAGRVPKAPWKMKEKEGWLDRGDGADVDIYLDNTRLLGCQGLPTAK